MSTPTELSMKSSPSTETPPWIISQPTVGRFVRLGELYDQRRSQFLGVQLYSESQIEKATETMNVNHSDLSLHQSNSYKDKTDSIGLNTQLSVEVLSGLVSVQGSASFLRDNKSTTQKRAWSMSLKMILVEKRLKFAEKELGRDVLPLVLEDYIRTDTATHFVSSVVYGGNLVVNLVAKTSKLTEDEKIEGSLGVKLDKLKGMVDVAGKVDASSKENFDDLNDKFDLTVYCDIALDKVPVNPVDVVTSFARAASRLREGGGVPISVTLQPIPDALRTRALVVHNINERLLDDLLHEFGALEDVRSRYAVLEEAAKTYDALVPAFAKRARKAAAEFRIPHRDLLLELSDAFRALLNGSQESKPTARLIKKAADLSMSHNADTILQPADNTGNPSAESTPENCASQTEHAISGLEEEVRDLEANSTLSALEDELSVLQSLIVAVERNGFHLSSVDDFSLAACTAASEMPVFLMPPLVGTGRDAKRLQLSALLRNVALSYTKRNPPTVCYVLYIEDALAFEERFPNDGRFAALAAPAGYIGQIDYDGTLTWTLIDSHLVMSRHPPVYNVDVCARTKGNSPDVLNGEIVHTGQINGSASFSIMVRAMLEKEIVPHGKSSADIHASGLVRDIVQVYNGTESVAALVVTNGRCVGLSVKHPNDGWKLHDSPPEQQFTARQYFWVTFVQDMDARKWYLYMGSKCVIEQAIPVGFDWGGMLHVHHNFGSLSWLWDGYVQKALVYSSSLTPDDVKDITENYVP
ncbi:uncharacterized protein FIBRA_08944 [Fibroporia radiculosa]|uniref:SNTX MACPF/CDC-like domain-containing protein n=1 Tax=Fibroporia radiculosa TaxID=599839 RepID=J4H5F7_9APHY|nr:uncharacterized protein FIBRA_08944 [Fibroporia radiculosa]CCM06659.1 predicted protein [Fibroporia radiculosa]